MLKSHRRRHLGANTQNRCDQTLSSTGERRGDFFQDRNSVTGQKHPHHILYYITYFLHAFTLHSEVYCMQNTPKFKLTHSKTRINPRGNLSTWNVSADASCRRHRGRMRALSFLSPINDTLINLAQHCSHLSVKTTFFESFNYAPDSRCPFQQTDTFLSHLLDSDVNNLGPQARTRLMRPSRVTVGCSDSDSDRKKPSLLLEG